MPFTFAFARSSLHVTKTMNQNDEKRQLWPVKATAACVGRRKRAWPATSFFVFLSCRSFFYFSEFALLWGRGAGRCAWCVQEPLFTKVQYFD